MAVAATATARTRTSSDTGTARWHAARAELGTKFNFQSRVESRMCWAGQDRAGQGRAHWHAGRKRHHRARHRHHCQWVSQAGWQFAIKLADWRFKVRAVQPSQGLSELPRCLLLIAIYQAHSMLYMLREKERDGERGKGCGGCFKSHVTVWTPVFRCSNAPQGVRLSCVIILI